MLSNEEFIELVPLSPSFTKLVFISYTPQSLADIFASIHEYMEPKLNSMDDFTILKNLIEKESTDFINVFNLCWHAHSRDSNKGIMFFVPKKIKQNMVKDWILEEAMCMLGFIGRKDYLNIGKFDKLILNYNYELSSGEKFAISMHYLSGFLQCKTMTEEEHFRIVLYTQVLLKDIATVEAISKKLTSINSPDFSYIVDEFVREHNTFWSRSFYPKVFRKNWSDKVFFVWNRMNHHIQNKNDN